MRPNPILEELFKGEMLFKHKEDKGDIFKEHYWWLSSARFFFAMHLEQEHWDGGFATKLTIRGTPKNSQRIKVKLHRNFFWTQVPALEVYNELAEDLKLIYSVFKDPARSPTLMGKPWLTPLLERLLK